MRSHPVATLVALAGMAMLAMGPVRAEPKDEIRATFGKFVAAQNAHDLKAVGELLSDSPDFLWIDRGRVVRRHDRALKRFEELFQSTWRVEPDWPTFHVVMLNVSTAELFVRVSITSGAPARSTSMNQIVVNTAHGWRVLTILTDETSQSYPERSSPTRATIAQNQR
jgi:ketosteroid isomerase-like protein